MNAILRSKNVITRKPHKCFGCMRTFPENTPMLFEAVAWDGTVDNNYFCASCQHVMSELSYMDTFGEGGLYDAAVEYEKALSGETK